MNVSLYVPCYNGAAWLAECIASLLAQDYPASEILVVDDGSTDSSAEIAQSFGPPVRLVRHERNRGLAVARNTALAEARHELVGAIDADVRAEPGWLGALVEALDTPRTVMVGGKLNEAHQERLADRWRAAHMPQHAGDFPLANPPVIPGANVLVRRGVVQALGGYDTTFRTNYEDADLQHRLIALGYRCRYAPGAHAFHLRTDTARSVLRTYWGWLRPPFERQGAFLSDEGLVAKRASTRELVERALWHDVSGGALDLTFLTLLVWLIFPAADFAHAALRTSEHGARSAGERRTAQAARWCVAADSCLADALGESATDVAGDLSRIVWWGTAQTALGDDEPDALAASVAPFKGEIDRMLSQVPRTWWPAIAEARSALARDEEWR